MLIVDSPGIADSEEMTNITLGYLSDAAAFVYVINSADAGGIAPDRVILHAYEFILLYLIWIKNTREISTQIFSFLNNKDN